MSAFDTNKPGGMCPISMKETVEEHLKDFVDFYIPASCLIKCIAVTDGLSSFHWIPQDEVYSQFKFVISLITKPSWGDHVQYVYCIYSIWQSLYLLQLTQFTFYCLLLSLLFVVCSPWQPVSRYTALVGAHVL